MGRRGRKKAWHLRGGGNREKNGKMKSMKHPGVLLGRRKKDDIISLRGGGKIAGWFNWRAGSRERQNHKTEHPHRHGGKRKRTRVTMQEMGETKVNERKEDNKKKKEDGGSTEF